MDIINLLSYSHNSIICAHLQAKLGKLQVKLGKILLTKLYSYVIVGQWEEV